MSITFKVHGKSGDYVRASVTPANHSEEPHFGVLDCAIVALFLLGLSGFIYLVMLS